jgi:hypothetical protein
MLLKSRIYTITSSQEHISSIYKCLLHTRSYNLHHNMLDFTHCSNCHLISEHACMHAQALSLCHFTTSYWIVPITAHYRGHTVAQWLRHCATNRKVAGSIPDDVTGIFHWFNPSSHTMALGLTQPLTEMSTRDISWGKGGWCIGLTTLPHSCADCQKIREPQPPGALTACQGLSRSVIPAFTAYYKYTEIWKLTLATFTDSVVLWLIRRHTQSCSHVLRQ